MGCIFTKKCKKCKKCGVSQDYYVYDYTGKNCRVHTYDKQYNQYKCIDCGTGTGNCSHHW